MKKKKRNGFTLIELLAVIVIMGILMMIAIPSVSRIIENSRKDTFVDIAKTYANAARTLWTTDGLTCEGTVSSAVDDGDYYILINTTDQARDVLPVLLDQGGKSSWGNRDVSGYVRVNVSTTLGQDNNGDGIYEVEPKRTTKFYVALSDGTHGLVDDANLTSDKLVKGNVNMALSEEEKKKVELTVADGRLDCAKNADGIYLCTEVKPVSGITGVCVDDQTNVSITGRVEINANNFANDDWTTISLAIKSGEHPYQVGDTKTIDMGSFGTHTVRIANLSTPSECSQANFSQTACGTVIEFVDIVTTHIMNPSGSYKGNSYAYGWNVDGWSQSSIRTYLNSDIYNALPSDLKNLIINTTVISGHGSTVGEVNFTSTDKLYLLATKEVWEQGTSNTIDSDTARENTRQLDYYKLKGVTTSANLSRVIKKYNGSNKSWWFRSGFSTSNSFFYGASSNGRWDFFNAIYNIGVSPAFRIT